MSWGKVKLGDITDSCLGKMLDQQKNRGEFQPYLANVNVRWGAFDLEDLPQMRFEENEQERYGLRYGDLVVCEGGEPGRCAIWKEQVPNMKIQKALHRVRVHDGLDYRYLYYWFLWAGRRGALDQYFTGATIKHMPGQKLKEVVIDKPSIEIQRRIADILSAYDNLIENNQKQIKLLEEAAQRLYKEWFVDLRFPGYETIPVLDGVPEGWEVQTLSQIADIVMGQSPKSEYYNQDGEGLPFHQGVGSYGDRFVANGTYSTSFTRIAEAGSILFSVRAPVGRLNLTKDRIVIGRGLAAINHHQRLQSYLFYLLKNRFFKDDIIGNGSIFASISKDDLLNQKLLVPDNTLAVQFNSIAYVIDKKISCLSDQIRFLTEARDRLLPELMSGELEV